MKTRRLRSECIQARKKVCSRVIKRPLSAVIPSVLYNARVRIRPVPFRRRLIVFRSRASEVGDAGRVIRFLYDVRDRLLNPTWTFLHCTHHTRTLIRPE